MLTPPRIRGRSARSVDASRTPLQLSLGRKSQRVVLASAEAVEVMVPTFDLEQVASRPPALAAAGLPVTYRPAEALVFADYQARGICRHDGKGGVMRYESHEPLHR